MTAEHWHFGDLETRIKIMPCDGARSHGDGSRRARTLLMQRPLLVSHFVLRPRIDATFLAKLPRGPNGYLAGADLASDMSSTTSRRLSMKRAYIQTVSWMMVGGKR